MVTPIDIEEDDSDGWVLRPRGYAWQELKQELKELGRQIREMIGREVTGLDESPAAIAERRRRVLEGSDGFEFFARTYFPHYVRSAEPSRLHEWLYQHLPVILDTPPAGQKKVGRNQVVIAPRGEAKSTFCSQIGVMFSFVRRLKHYAIVIMDVFAQACGMVEAIKAELEANVRLRLDFPEICGKGPVWREGEIVTRAGQRLEAAGAGMKLRGRRHGPHRPDIVILDDLENDETVATKEQRDKLDAWVDKAVLNLGEAGDSMDVIYVGTVLHRDAVIQRKAKNPMWRCVRFRSILAWPDRMDLWERWEEIVRSADPSDDADKDRAQADAQAFYGAHQAEMEAGAQVSWPSVRPLLQLMQLRVKIGAAAFSSEQQNAPENEEGDFRKLVYWVHPRPWIFGAACDPSMGKESKKNDPSALVVLGLDRDTGIVDVVEAAICRRVPDRIISDVIELQRQYRCLLWGIETVQFQAFLFSELVKRSAVAGVPVPAVPLLHAYSKELRIRSLQPHVANGLIRFSARHTTLRDQLEEFPNGDHDDGPDALEMAWRIIGMIRAGGGTIAVGGSRPMMDQMRAYSRLPDGAETEDWGRQLGGWLQ